MRPHTMDPMPSCVNAINGILPGILRNFLLKTRDGRSTAYTEVMATRLRGGRYSVHPFVSS
jgi:hypothetical protein